MLFGELFNIPSTEISTASVYLLSLVGLLILGRISRPANLYHVFVFVICIAGIILSATMFSDLFGITEISLKAIALCGVFALAETQIMTWLSEFFSWIQKPHRSK